MVGLVGLGLGLAAGSAGEGDPSSAAPAVVDTEREPPSTSTSTSTPPDPVIVEVPRPLLSPDQAVERAGAIARAGFTAPSDCPVQLDNPRHLPNGPREYRTGVHQGIDFFCPDGGRHAVAALPGRVVVATHGWREADPADRQALLDQTAELGRTPAALLTMLWGRHVVVDHGVVPGAGHVTTVYAHLAGIDDAVQTGSRVEAGQQLGTIGASGTEAGATGRDDPSEVHLHWELHVDDRYLGEGLAGEETRRVYATLLAR